MIGRNLTLTVSGAAVIAAEEKETGKTLTKLQRSLRDDGVTAHVVHTRGDPRTGIIEQAERLDATYIVIGSHGHTAFYDLLVGSTTSGVLKHAKCPLVIVPVGAPESAKPPAPAGDSEASKAAITR